MRTRFLSTFASTVTAVALVGGCSGGSTPNATTPSAAPSQTGKALPYAGAPKVENPLPESVLSGHPCDGALTPDQLSQILTIQPQGEHADNPALGTECQWRNSEAGALATVLYATKVPDGLSALYAKTKPQSTVWRTLSPIQGFPAVAHSTYSNETSKAFCQVSVGISDQREIDVSLSLGEAKVNEGADPCELTGRVADMVVTNLRQKAGA
ncbi:DUF3558 domain-containing protein [Amycolatopsis ultiminotia]|uniref:DUF3558 domain-containing protein n=1 Tax=Amycolatopsis ultiminotia TaxID=543629 RepID=A0ABP6X5G2_9PSEU